MDCEQWKSLLFQLFVTSRKSQVISLFYFGNPIKTLLKNLLHNEYENISPYQ